MVKQSHMVRMLGQKAREMKDEDYAEEQDEVAAMDDMLKPLPSPANKKRRHTSQDTKKNRQTAYDQLFEAQEKTLISQAKQISKFEQQLSQYKEVLVQSNKLAGVVCFKMADLANVALKQGYYFEMGDQARKFQHGVYNEDEWHSGFFLQYEKLRSKDQSAKFVTEKGHDSFKPLAKLLTLVHKNKDEYIQKAKESNENAVQLSAAASAPSLRPQVDVTHAIT